jgi:hypothetical protein
MNDGKKEDYRDNQVEGLFPDSVLQDLGDTIHMSIIVTCQAWREFMYAATGNRFAAYTYDRQEKHHQGN